MKKKMTAKEFKEIIKRCGIDNSYESCLARISNYYHNEGIRFKKEGYEHAAKWYEEMSDIMTDELDARGYFD